MAYFKLSLLSKAYDESDKNRYIENTISEFYSNDTREELLQYKVENNLHYPLPDTLDNVYTKTYTYNEKLSTHQQAQKELTFSLDKMIIEDDTWKDNPFASKIKTGSQLLLEDKFNNFMLFTVKNITYTISENNITYSFTCQDSFTFQLSKQNDGYTIENDSSSANFIGAMDINAWAEKITSECKIAYRYLRLETPLYLCKDGTATNTTINHEAGKSIVKTIKEPYINNKTNEDLYETFPFSCSSTTAKGALVSLGEQVGLAINTATVLSKPKNRSNFIDIITYFWFEPSKKSEVSGLQYSPFRNIKTLTLSQSGDSLITALNINSRTLSSDEVITALPTVSPFFLNFFTSTYWRKYSSYFDGMYTDFLHGTQVSLTYETNSYQIVTTIDSRDPDVVYIQHEVDSDIITFSKTLDEVQSALCSLYDTSIFEKNNVISAITTIDSFGNVKVFTPENCIYSAEIIDNVLFIYLTNSYFSSLGVSDYIDDFELYAFFQTEYNAEDESFAKIADELPWLENKLIDYTYFSDNGLLSKIQEQNINQRIYNDLRKINSDILLYSTSYYSRLHAQTKYLADMTNNIDMVGAETSSITEKYLENGSGTDYDSSNLLIRWNLLQSNLTTGADVNSFGHLYDTVSDYMRKFLVSRQRCLKNLYNFRQYFNSKLDSIYQTYYKVTVQILDGTGSDSYNIYRFKPSNTDTYTTLTNNFIQEHPNFFSFENGLVKDYNNIVLYNNDTQHTIFNKDSYLLTESNFDDMTLYCYQDQLIADGAFTKYDKETTYLKKVWFIRKNDLFTADFFVEEGEGNHSIADFKNSINEGGFNLILAYGITEEVEPEESEPAEPEEETEEAEETEETEEPTTITTYYPLRFTFYSEDANYLVCSKYYEDGTSLEDWDTMKCMKAKIVIRSGNSSYTFVEKENADWASLLSCLIASPEDCTSADTTVFSNTSFYQEISENDIMCSYLYRQKDILNPKIKTFYTPVSFYSLLSNFTAANRSYTSLSGAITSYNMTSETANTKLGWYRSSIADVAKSMFWTLRWLSPIVGLTSSIIANMLIDDKILCLGGYTAAPYHITNQYGTFAPYTNTVDKRASVYVHNFPLSTVYDDNGQEITVVNSTNYQNFYTLAAGIDMTAPTYTLASNGTYCATDGFVVTSDRTKPYKDFLSSLPAKHFYTTQPVNRWEAVNVAPYLAYTLGNYIYNKGEQETSPYKDWTYRLTKTYRYTTSIDSDLSYLVVPNNFAVERDLNQYIDYDIIEKGEIISGDAVQRYSLSPYTFYQVIDGRLNDLSDVVEDDILDIFTGNPVQSNGKTFALQDFMSSEGIVQNLYHLKTSVRISPSSIEDRSEEDNKYNLKNHLLDNTYELYNDRDERVYTINQLIGNLVYKEAQFYTYYTFDTTTPYSVKLYRYNNASVVPDVINFNLDTTHTTQTDPNYPDLQLRFEITSARSFEGDNPTLGAFWYNGIVNKGFDGIEPLLEYAALIESNLQLYWNEAYAASLSCNIFVPSEWRPKTDGAENHYKVVTSVTVLDNTYIVLNNAYVPMIKKTNDKQFSVIWKDTVPQIENTEIYGYEQLSIEQKMEVQEMLRYAQGVNLNNLWFNKLTDKNSFYTIQTGGMTWDDVINQILGISLNGYGGWNGIAINYLTSHFIDAGISNYEILLEQRDNLWREFYDEYPYLFLETSYTDESATTSEELLQMAKYAFQDQKYPEKSYSIALIDLVFDVENLDTESESGKTKYTPKYYREKELHIGDSIKIAADDYITDRDDIYEALSQLLFITDISRDLRNDGDCQLTVNTIKYQDKLIRRLAKLIRNNPLR